MWRRKCSLHDGRGVFTEGLNFFKYLKKQPVEYKSSIGCFFYAFLKSVRVSKIITIRLKNANGSDPIIRNFCIAVSTLVSGLIFPKTTIASEKIRMMIAQINRYLLFGFSLPLEVNMLSTYIAESTEVTRKLISNITVKIFVKIANG